MTDVTSRLTLARRRLADARQAHAVATVELADAIGELDAAANALVDRAELLETRAAYFAGGGADE